MSFFLGGVLADAQIKIKREREDKTITVRMDEVRDGDFVDTTSRWMWQVDELRMVRKKLTAYRFKLDTGQAFTCCAGTVLAGVAGNKFLSPQAEEPTLFFARHTRFGPTDRRRFCVELYGKQAAGPGLLGRFQPVQQKSRVPVKKYYFIDDAYRVLYAAKADPEDRVVAMTGVRVCATRPEGIQHLNLAGYEVQNALRATVPFPFFRVGESDTKPVAIAITDLGDFKFGQVVSIEEFASDGPWYFPSFHHGPESLRENREAEHRDSDDKTYNPLSVIVDGVPMFIPDDFILPEHFEATENPNVPTFVDPPKPRIRIYSVDDAFESAPAVAKPQVVQSERDFAARVFQVLGEAKAQGMAADAVVAAMENIVNRDPTSTTVVPPGTTPV